MTGRVVQGKGSMNLVRAGLALVPNEQFRKKFIALQERCRSQVILVPRLGEDENLPHLTLFQGWFAADTPFESLIENLQKTLWQAGFLPKLKLIDIRFYEPGWYFLLVEKEQWLAELQRQSLKVLLEQAQAAPPGQEKITERYTPLELENYRKYGYRFIGDAFLPHITLGHTKSGREAGFDALLPDLWDRSGINSEQGIESIAIYAVGEHGAYRTSLCNRSLKSP
jgi:2'-5' RNA ligase